MHFLHEVDCRHCSVDVRFSYEEFYLCDYPSPRSMEIFKGCNYRDHGRETLINNCLNTVAKLLERFKRAKKDFIDVLTLDNFVTAETEKL